MKFCSKCGKEIADDAVVCIHCGRAVEGADNAALKNVKDEVSVGLCILSFLIPLFGIIYWAMKCKETPKRAKACGITALVTWGVGILVSILFSTVILAAL